MLKATSIDLFYGASQALHGVSLDAQAGKSHLHSRSQWRGQDQPDPRHLRPDGDQSWQPDFAASDITKMSTAERARHGMALVPQGREIFAQLTVEENLKTGFAVLPRSRAATAQTKFSNCFRC